MFEYGYEILIDPLLKDIREITPVFSGMKPGDRVLDVCCGTGAQVIEYGRRGIYASGLDISIGMLKVAVKNQKKNGMEHLAFYKGDAACLPFEDNSFDYVSVSFGLHDKEKTIRNKVISEMKRVVKKEGSLIFTDFQVPLQGNVWALFAKSVERLVGGSHYRGFREFILTGGLQEILKVHSLRAVRRYHLKGGLVVIIKAVVL